MATRRVVFQVNRNIVLDGSPVAPGKYVGDEIVRSSVNHAGGMLVSYQMEFGAAVSQNEAVVAVVKRVDVTLNVNNGEIELLE